LKKFTTFILALLVLLAFASIANASLPLVGENTSPDNIPYHPEYGMIVPKYGKNSALFTDLRYWVTATGATSGTRYRTPRIWILLGGQHTLWFDTQALAEWMPPAGETLAAAVKIDITEIFKEMVAVIPDINTVEEAEEEFYWYEHLKIGPEIEIYNVGTGEAISERQHTPAGVETLMRNHGFGNVHIDDVLARFQQLPMRNYLITVSHNLVQEHTGSWGIDYNGKKYEFVKQLGFELFKVEKGTTKTFQSLSDQNYEYLVGAYESMGRISFDKIFVEDTEITVTVTKEHNIMTVNLYYIEKVVPDFEVVSLEPGISIVEPGDDCAGTVSYKLKDTVSNPVEAQLYLAVNKYPLKYNGERLYEYCITFQPGETKTINFSWIGQESNKMVTEIWPTEPAELDKEQRDADPSDNRKQITIPVKPLPAPPPLEDFDPSGEMGRPKQV